MIILEPIKTRSNARAFLLVSRKRPLVPRSSIFPFEEIKGVLPTHAALPSTFPIPFFSNALELKKIDKDKDFTNFFQKNYSSTNIVRYFFENPHL
jgi:hypothetical protein